MNITIMLPAGRLPLDVMAKAYALAEKYRLGVYLSTARWISCADRKKLDEFTQKKQSSLALDGEGHLAFLAPSEWNLSRTMELFPDIVFHKTREYS